MFHNTKVYPLFILCMMLFLSGFYARQQNFLMRLSGGSVQNKNFKTELPFTYIDERICIQAKINNSDKDFSFILDTYAPCLIRESLISSIPLDTLDLTEQMGQQLEGSMMKPLFPIYNTLGLGKVTFKDIGAMVMREDEDNAFLRVLEDGLIGSNLLKCCVWQFNFKDKKMVITDQISMLDHLTDAIQIPFKPISIQQSPNIQVVLNNKEKIDVQFDTGSKGFLTFSSASLLSMVDSGDAVAVFRRSISPVKRTNEEIETYHFVKLEMLTLGNSTFHDLPVGVYQAQETKEETKGSIGIEFMKYFIVTLDWPEKQIYLKQTEDKALKQNIRTFGLTYDYFDGAIRVGTIYGGSEVEKKGIKIGDRISEINGYKVDTLSQEKIQSFLHGKLHFSKDSDESLTLVIHSKRRQEEVKLYSYFLFK